VDVGVHHPGADPEVVATDSLHVRRKATGRGRTDVVDRSVSVDDHGARERFNDSARPDRADQDRTSA
jgi:hypothetical protein